MSASTTMPTLIHVRTESTGSIPPVDVCRLSQATYRNTTTNATQAPKAPSPAKRAILGGIKSPSRLVKLVYPESSPGGARHATGSGRGAWSVDRTQLRQSAWLARSSRPRTLKAVRPRVEIPLGGTTDPFNPCCYPLNPYPKVLGTSRAALLLASRSARHAGLEQNGSRMPRTGANFRHALLCNANRPAAHEGRPIVPSTVLAARGLGTAWGTDKNGH